MKTKLIVLLSGLLSVGAVATASAADMAVKARPLPPVPVYSWTGCYIGVQGGGKWGTNRVNYEQNVLAIAPGTRAAADYDNNGWLVGGTVGCNYQTGNWVFGIEGDGAWAEANGEAIETAFPAFRIRTEENWLATIRGRVGYAFAPQVLVYVTGGGAFSGVTLRNYVPGSALLNVSQENTLSGWTVGGGFEYGFTPNWSVKVEGLYIEYQRSNYFRFNDPVAGATMSNRLTEGVARVGLNYRFGGPVVARY
jgi:outer membrane immunogenic protein